jgi:hypothetical protein
MMEEMNLSVSYKGRPESPSATSFDTRLEKLIHRPLIEFGFEGGTRNLSWSWQNLTRRPFQNQKEANAAAYKILRYIKHEKQARYREATIAVTVGQTYPRKLEPNRITQMPVSNRISNVKSEPLKEKLNW